MRPGRAQRAPTEWATLLLSLLLLAGSMSAAAAPVPHTLTDQTGKTLTLPAQVNKIVAIPIPLASMVMAIDGGTTRLSGINSAAKSDIDEGLLGRMFPGAAKISTRIAGDNFVPNSEALAASRADLVIQWGDRGEAIIDPIRTLHIPMLTLRYGDSLWAAEWLRLTGAALGKAERGERLAVWFEKHVAKITALGEAVPAKSRPRVLHLTRAREALVAAGKGTSMDGDIRRTGGVNLAGEVPGFSQISVEQLLAWNPDI
ncbi:MAG: ABC transporter substrate-binding protein, partial [Zoogloeaceae bacterium]|nr:ABC transporter substrate-binding protein [Zoogloeaceae bacterium]